ncbi:hypothetical protein PQD71_gp160 [Kosakonia phage Kc263]|uniref:Uncharacterized protein n=1 Tax=Kosakonia phage Kc263 TaxID=2863194 RepID=A0AAE7WFR2_9CAUD|nr:hypothetical protein PQD71_gp160 [Kosakonia phage Kc263]QYN80053.1 hypothetical protein [Kosakonia phage Kc263]
MTTITKNIVEKAAIAISSFLKTIDQNATAGEHEILLVDSVPVSVEIKADDETYIATGKVAGYTVVKTAGYIDPAFYPLNEKDYPEADEVAAKITKAMFGFADHKGDTYYDVLCAVDHPTGEEFSATLATGHRLLIVNGNCSVINLNGDKLEDVVLEDCRAFGSAMLHISRAIAKDMVTNTFTPFELKVY